MARISASSLNKMSKCELAWYLGKTPEGKAFLASKKPSYSLILGSITHKAVQEYDTDRYLHGVIVPKTREEVFNRIYAAHYDYWTDPQTCEKENIDERTSKYLVEKILPALHKWMLIGDPVKQKELESALKAAQRHLPWSFSAKKPLTAAYLQCFEMVNNYIFNCPLDVLGTPDHITIEKRYVVKFGHEDIFDGYLDERRVYMVNGKPQVYVIEFKTSATEYTPEDCQIDNQMGLYAFYEHIDSGIPYEDIYVVMMQFVHNKATITQRNEATIDLLIGNAETRLDRMNKIQAGYSRPMPLCGTNSWDHSRLMCDFKDICPVWQQIQNQPQPRVIQGRID